MARQLVPIKVTIRLNPDGTHKYPDFNSLDTIIASGQDWSEYVDVQGLGWHYDKCCGHKEDSAESPFGCQHGVLVVPKAFADDAVANLADVTKLTEAELEDFYDNKAHAHEPDEEIDDKVISGIKAKQDLGIPLTAHQQKALDVNDDTVRGIRKNKNKVWKDYKAKVGVTIVQ